MNKNLQYEWSKTRLKIVILLFFFITGCIFLPRFIINNFGSEVEAQTKSTPRKSKKVTPTPTPVTDKFSNFSHKNHVEDLSLECNACHKFPTKNWNQVRKKDEAFEDVTDFPKHDSCIDCHREQFFTGRPPTICSNCHTNPSPNDSSRHPFPNPREIYDASSKGKNVESEFQVFFPHDKHIDIVSQYENQYAPNQTGVSFIKVRSRWAEESCKVCHQTYKPQDSSDVEYYTTPPKDLGDGFWLKKGTFKTAPIGHTNCFTCHSVDSGLAPAPTDCGTCHKIKQPLPTADFDGNLAGKIGVNDKIMLDDWKKRDSSGTFRHEWFSHNELSCATCHNVTAMNTTDSKTKKIKVLSCGGDGTGCHITPTSDDGGILNMEIDSKKKDAKFDCVKCHISFGKSPIPDSHIKAITEITKGKKN